VRIVLHSILRAGQEEAYEREHATVWPDLLAALQQAGISDWSIWRSGPHLFHVVETDDFQAAMERLAVDPVDQRWQQHMAAFVDHFEPEPRHVWTLRDQARDEDGA
jgi:L-rhamnose mutarotase